MKFYQLMKKNINSIFDFDLNDTAIKESFLVKDIQRDFEDLKFILHEIRSDLKNFHNNLTENLVEGINCDNERDSAITYLELLKLNLSQILNVFLISKVYTFVDYNHSFDNISKQRSFVYSRLNSIEMSHNSVHSVNYFVRNNPETKQIKTDLSESIKKLRSFCFNHRTLTNTPISNKIDLLCLTQK